VLTGQLAIVSPAASQDILDFCVRELVKLAFTVLGFASDKPLAASRINAAVSPMSKVARTVQARIPSETAGSLSSRALLSKSRTTIRSPWLEGIEAIRKSITRWPTWSVARLGAAAFRRDCRKIGFDACEAGKEAPTKQCIVIETSGVRKEALRLRLLDPLKPWMILRLRFSTDSPLNLREFRFSSTARF
jgi:hypothetical protein